MTAYLLSSTLVLLFAKSLVGQEESQNTTPAAQVTAGAPTTGPTQDASTVVLQDGTPIKLRLLNKLDSHSAKNGDEIPFDVVNDVVVGGVTVLRRGSLATGVITQAKASATMGRAGKLSFIINDIKLGNGSRAPVRAYNRTTRQNRSTDMARAKIGTVKDGTVIGDPPVAQGENRTGEMVADMVAMPIVAAPFFLLIHGSNPTFPRGTEITAFVNGDIRLDPTSF